MVVVNRYLLHLLAHHTCIPSRSPPPLNAVYLLKRCLTCPPPFDSAKNAYDVLGVSESSSFSEIKSCFRKLAKQTHPDLSPTDPFVSQQFVQILAAYEILSDSEKRAHYDKYLLSQRSVVQRQSRQGSVMYKYESHRTMKQMEVVEWLRWYRYTISDILSERRVVVGSGYFDVLERDFYSSLHAAYYGPEIESMDLLPDSFEAEERSASETPEVLHIVSGRDLFGIVRIAERIPEISHTDSVKLSASAFADSRVNESIENAKTQKKSGLSNLSVCQMHTTSSDQPTSDAYKDLELHMSGRVIAVATRIPPMRNEDSEDHINVYLNSTATSIPLSLEFPRDSEDVASGSRTPLGTIIGLGTSPDEGLCYVHNNFGIKTHVIMKHRTLLVKHLHWYHIGDEASVCECRCRRARLPPSRFWLFEPRCGLHDIGGWYVETFGRDKKGRNVLSRRYWDGLDTGEQFDKRLHPAMYLLALAYRTLDIENKKKRKQTRQYVSADNISRILSWWKKLV
ncbi:J domain-containing protein [Heracleum sosnowskyi]|uniref:J domain-containing protein n=1 Tax=Heracleum sosnowskyi TaxID=360622 RepID=A0AAD8HWN6_9APIA|nr:J domain-containing protein [Heracleum sosnowskyi]